MLPNISTHDGMPYAHSIDNPVYRASLDRFHEVSDAFSDAFREALTVVVEAEPDLSGRFLDRRGRMAQMPWLEWEGDPRGGYWIACGLQHYSELPESVWPTFLWASYLRDSEDGETHDRDERPFDLKLTDASARDVTLLAELTVAVLRRHRTTLSG